MKWIGKDDHSLISNNLSVFAIAYAKSTSSQWNENIEYNRMFLSAQETYFNHLLKAQGHLFLNEIYDGLGLKRTQAGATHGWIIGCGDDHIEFTVKELALAPDMLYVDFNVWGVIYDKAFTDKKDVCYKPSWQEKYMDEAMISVIKKYTDNDLHNVREGMKSVMKHTLEPNRIIFSGPKTIVIWGDNTKTIVSCMDGDNYDPYTGFCAALAKKIYGSTSAGKRIMEKYKTVQKPKKKIVKVPVDLSHPSSFADAINRTLDAMKRRFSDD